MLPLALAAEILRLGWLGRGSLFLGLMFAACLVHTFVLWIECVVGRPGERDLWMPYRIVAAHALIVLHLVAWCQSTTPDEWVFLTINQLFVGIIWVAVCVRCVVLLLS
jgi:hypothetical protein